MGRTIEPDCDANPPELITAECDDYYECKPVRPCVILMAFLPLSQSSFRQRMKLDTKDRAYLADQGLAIVLSTSRGVSSANDSRLGAAIQL